MRLTLTLTLSLTLALSLALTLTLPRSPLPPLRAALQADPIFALARRLAGLVS